RELEPLRLAAAERVGGLAELEIAEADRLERIQFLHDARHVLEMRHRLAHRHGQRVRDVRAAEARLERLAVVARAAAARALDVRIAEEKHVELDRALALAALAAPAARVEA